MVSTYDTQALRESSLRYQWMHNRDWTQMAEEGEPTIIVEGQGVRITDSTGGTWLDAQGGYTSVHVGYGRHEIGEAAYEQLKRINFSPVNTTSIPVIELCAKLDEITPGTDSRIYLSSGGSEANETALKLIRTYYKRRGEDKRHKIISRKGSYHGTTYGVMWLGEHSRGVGLVDFEPAYPGMLYAPQPNPYRCEMGGQTPSECAIRCAKAVEDLIVFHKPETVAAVIAEPISQPHGAVVPGDEYWPMLREICDKYGVVLVADEVITGFGRTGKMWGLDHWGVEPDIMNIAKGVSSSYAPLAGTVVKKEIADYFGGEGNSFLQAITASAHPVTAAVGLKNMEILENENLVENSAEMGEYFTEHLEQLKLDHPSVGNVMGRGLLQAIDLVSDRETKAKFPKEAEVERRLAEKFKARHLILNAQQQIIRIGPPLCITRDEVDEIMAGIDSSLGELERELSIS